ncbi:MAG: PD-(D/E)XK nuclease family protein [Bifidobacteriaceae bacterium]|jgi:putative RecB family exonuclease|nr:PD-(D/E)XK nuclease family protein [Bifidobacteriaceae bacterium]
MAFKAVLAPTRINQYQTCPLQYRLAAIDKIVPPIPPSIEAVRGSVVHAILEALFKFPMAERTQELALSQSIIQQAQEQVRQKEGPKIYDQLIAEYGLEKFLDDLQKLVMIYFELENPSLLIRPSDQEVMLKVDFPEASDLALFGYADRIDYGRNNEVRIIDYKTGKMPDERYAASYRDQMDYYALAYYLLYKTMPYALHLIFLNPDSHGIIKKTPNQLDLDLISQTIITTWNSIKQDCQNLYFQPVPNNLCEWCGFKDFCPAKGGQMPELTKDMIQKSLHI